MPVREKERIITLAGRRWKIEKFDALTGSYIAMKLGSKLANIAVGVFAGNLRDPAIIAMSVANEIGSLTKQEFNDVQAECLHVVKEMIQTGNQDIPNPIRLPDGKWGVEGLEYDGLLVMGLVSHALLFNLSGFTDAAALKDLKESFQGLISFNTKTSTDTPSPQ